MNKALKLVVAGSLACGLGVGATSVATASTSSGPTTISFTERTTSDQTFNLGPQHGVAVGFVDLTADDDMQGVHKIGHDAANCTITRLGGGTADDLCSLVFVLARGQIDATGLVTSTPSGPGTFTLAIVGGTGAYSHVRGEATFVPTDPAPHVTVHLDE